MGMCSLQNKDLLGVSPIQIKGTVLQIARLVMSWPSGFCYSGVDSICHWSVAKVNVTDRGVGAIFLRLKVGVVHR